MKLKFSHLFSITAIVVALASSASLRAQGGHVAYPSDVSNFIRDRDNCDTLRGDIPDPDEGVSKSDMDNLVKSINKACYGTDKRLEALKKRYANGPLIMKKLNSYETDIEAK